MQNMPKEERRTGHRLSVRLTEEDRLWVIQIKARLAEKKQALEPFVIRAMRTQAKKEKLTSE